MINFLANLSHPYLQFATHQCDHFCSHPKLLYEQVVKHLVKYIKTTLGKRIRFKQDKSKGLECYVDADFAGG